MPKDDKKPKPEECEGLTPVEQPKPNAAPSSGPKGPPPPPPPEG